MWVEYNNGIPKISYISSTRNPLSSPITILKRSAESEGTKEVYYFSRRYKEIVSHSIMASMEIVHLTHVLVIKHP